MPPARSLGRLGAAAQGWPLAGRGAERRRAATLRQRGEAGSRERARCDAALARLALAASLAPSPLFARLEVQEIWPNA